MNKKILLFCLVRVLYICVLCFYNLWVSGVGVNPKPFEETEYSIIGGRNIFTDKKEEPVIPVAPPLTEPESVEEETTPQRVSEVEDVILTGIIFLDGKYQVLLEDTMTNNGFILGEGETFEGKDIKVVSVSEKTVILESGEENVEMVLERKSRAGAPGPAPFPGIGYPPLPPGMVSPPLPPGMVYPPGFPGVLPGIPPVPETTRTPRVRRTRTGASRFTSPPGGTPGMETENLPEGGWE